jgi:hypothetical protein
MEINIRVDKNLAYNILDFRKIEDFQTRSILKSLLLYFSFQYEKDLFGYGRLDPVEFSKMFNYDRRNLSRHVEEPKYKTDELNSNIEWNTYLENALYILATTPIFEEYKGQDENYNIVGFKNYIILKEILRYTPKKISSGKPKKYYKYILDNSFETNLKKFFLNINVKYYLETRKWNGDDFYLQIMNIYNQSKKDGKSSFYWEIKELIEYFNVAHKEIRVQKQRLNSIFKKYENLLKNDIKGLSFVWKKTGSQKFAYTLFMIWEKEDPKQLTEEKILILEQLFLDTLKRELYNVYNVDKSPKKETLNDFYNWLIDKKNKETIILIHKSVTNNLKGKNNWGADSWAITFYNKISVIRDIDLMNKCFIIESK